MKTNMVVHPSPKDAYYIKLNRVYLANCKTIGNSPKNKLHKPKFFGRKVKVLKNNPTNSDIPSLEHGNVHLYDAETNEYLGVCGIHYFARSIGVDV